MTLKLTSSAITEGARIPRKHAYLGEGDNVSPSIAWSGVPKGTQELALICDDPDAPVPEPWVHWVVYGIPPGVSRLEEGHTGDALEGLNGWGEEGWGGPKPPPGHGPHRYYFKLYALDAPLGLEAGATKQEVLAAMQGHIVAAGQLMGTYERSRAPSTSV